MLGILGLVPVSTNSPVSRPYFFQEQQERLNGYIILSTRPPLPLVLCSLGQAMVSVQEMVLAALVLHTALAVPPQVLVQRRTPACGFNGNTNCFLKAFRFMAKIG